MENKKLTIEDLLNSLQKPNKALSLENTKEIWRRIGLKDSFLELGLKSSELDDFLKEWVENNDYNNI